MKVRTEVSQLTNQGAVQLSAGNSTIQVPALTVRRAETTVELGSGESFAIAGLLQDAVNVTGNGVPFLGDVPILGALFRSDNFQRNETELVIVVTPYLVRPVAQSDGVASADGRLSAAVGSGADPAAAADRAADRSQQAASLPPPHIPGNAGFIVQ